MEKNSFELKVAKLKDQIRNPESRTKLSDIILSLSKEFFHQAIAENQKIKQLLDQEEAMILIEGSVLRGVATAHTHDIDVSTFMKENSDSGSSRFSPMDLRVGAQRFDQWMATQMTQRYSALHQEMIDEYKSRYGQQPKDNVLLTMDCERYDPASLDVFLEQGSLEALKGNATKYQIRIALQLLTTDPSFVLYGEQYLGEYQHEVAKKIEFALATTDNPEKVAAIKADLNDVFINLHRSTEHRYPIRDAVASLEIYARRMKLSEPEYSALKKQILDICSRWVIINILDTYKKHSSARYKILQEESRDDLPADDPQSTVRYLRSFDMFSGNTLSIQEIRKIIDDHVAGKLQEESQPEIAPVKRFFRWQQLMNLMRDKIIPFKD